MPDKEQPVATKPKPPIRETRRLPASDDWTLTTDQMIFMLQHHNPIEAAYRANNLAFLRELAESKDYRRFFGSMSWDEAYDRYESTLLDNDNADSSMAS